MIADWSAWGYQKSYSAWSFTCAKLFQGSPSSLLPQGTLERNYHTPIMYFFSNLYVFSRSLSLRSVTDGDPFMQLLEERKAERNMQICFIDTGLLLLYRNGWKQYLQGTEWKVLRKLRFSYNHVRVLCSQKA